MLYLAEMKHEIKGCFVFILLSPVDECSPDSRHTFAIILSMKVGQNYSCLLKALILKLKWE